MNSLLATAIQVNIVCPLRLEWICTIYNIEGPCGHVNFMFDPLPPDRSEILRLGRSIIHYSPLGVRLGTHSPMKVLIKCQVWNFWIGSVFFLFFFFLEKKGLEVHEIIRSTGYEE